MASIYRHIKAQWTTLRATVERLECHSSSGIGPTPSELMEQLLIAGEDSRFHYHPGVDVLALCRASWRTFCGSRQGGSTVAMQLVRTITGRYERTWQRKAFEIALALLLTRRFGKLRLPALYLYVAYYGWNMNGFPDACKRLRLDPETMSRHDAAKLVARLKYPEPRLTSASRTAQIERRAGHLLSLVGRSHKVKGNRDRGFVWSLSE